MKKKILILGKLDDRVGKISLMVIVRIYFAVLLSAAADVSY